MLKGSNSLGYEGYIMITVVRVEARELSLSSDACGLRAGVVRFVVYVLEVMALGELLENAADNAELGERVRGQDAPVPARQDVSDGRAAHEADAILKEEHPVPEGAVSPGRVGGDPEQVRYPEPLRLLLHERV